MRRSLLLVAPLLLALLLPVTRAAAQLPLHPPEIRTVFPIGGNRGSTVEVRVDGVNIGEAAGAVVSGTGVSAEVLGPDGRPRSPGAPPEARIVSDTGALVRFRIDVDAEPGVREFRLYTPVGLSCRGLFLIGPEGPSVRESGSGGTPQEFTVPGAADGRMDAAEDADRYRFQAKSGESFAFYVQAQQAESALDSILTLRDSSGKTLASNDDFRGKDAALEFAAPAAGEYTLEVNDVDSGGGPGYGYRLIGTRGPFVRTTYPLGAPAGTLCDVSLFGLNLGDLGKTRDFYSVPFDAAQARVRLPEAGVTVPSFQVAAPRGLTNPFTLQALDVPDIREQEPNDETEQSLRVAVPGVAHGRIFGSPTSPGGDQDRWKFSAKKGQKLRFRVQAMRLGSPLDPSLAVRSLSGEKLAGADDAEGSRDPSLEWEPPADGDYVAEVTEVSGGGAIDCAYMLRVEPVTPPPPDFSLSLYPANPSVPRGGSVPVEVRVSRTGGFTGPLTYELPPLPAGVTALIPPEAATMERFYIALTAAPDAPYGMVPFGLRATGTIDGKPVAREATGKERVWKNAPLRPVDTTLYQVAVCEPMDFTVQLDRDTLELKPGEKRDVKVIVRKIRGYPRGIPIRAATVDYGGGALPAGLDVGRVTLAAEASEVTVPVSAAPETAPGEYTVFVCALSNPTTNDYILIAHLAPPLKVRVAAAKCE